MKKYKKKILALLSFSMLLSSFTLSAENPIRAQLGGVDISFDQPPVIEDGRTLVPARAILETLGLTLEFDEATSVVTAKNDETTIIMTLGSTTVNVNGKNETIEVPAKIISGRTMVPIRFIGETMDLEVDWDAPARLITLETKELEVKTDDNKTADSVDFSKDYYVNYPDILNFVKYAEIPAENITVTTNTKDSLIYKVKISDVSNSVKKAYIDKLVADGFTLLEMPNIGGLSITSLTKPMLLTQFSTNTNDQDYTITVNKYAAPAGTPAPKTIEEIAKTPTPTPTTTEKTTEQNKKYYYMSNSDIEAAAQEGMKGNDNYTLNIEPRYIVKATSGTVFENEIKVTIETPYFRIAKSGLDFTRNSASAKTYNEVITSAKNIYSSTFSSGNKVILGFQFDKKNHREFEKEDISIMQDGEVLEASISASSYQDKITATLMLDKLDPTKPFELVAKTVGSEIVFEIDLSKYQ